jgi:hypothetical protein
MEAEHNRLIEQIVFRKCELDERNAIIAGIGEKGGQRHQRA